MRGVGQLLGERSSTPARCRRPSASARGCGASALAEMPAGDFFLVALVDGRIVGHGGLHAAGKSPRRSHAMMLGLMAVDRRVAGQGRGQRAHEGAHGCSPMDGSTSFASSSPSTPTTSVRVALYRQVRRFVIEGTYKGLCAARRALRRQLQRVARIKPKTAPV